MSKKHAKYNTIKNYARLLPTTLGIDEYDINLKKLNSNNKEDFDCVSICMITIICFVMYVSLSKSLTIDEFL